MRQLTTRSALYVLAYFNSIVWGGVTFLIVRQVPWIRQLGELKFMVFQIVYSFCVLLQGALNCIIYVMPIVTEEQKKHPTLSRINILYQLIINNDKVVSIPSSPKPKPKTTTPTPATSGLPDTTARTNNSSSAAKVVRKAMVEKATALQNNKKVTQNWKRGERER